MAIGRPAHLANGNGIGWVLKTIGLGTAVGGMILTLGLVIFAPKSDTPSRTEMQSADILLKRDINARLNRIENKLDKLLESD